MREQRQFYVIFGTLLLLTGLLGAVLLMRRGIYYQKDLFGLAFGLGLAIGGACFLIAARRLRVRYLELKPGAETRAVDWNWGCPLDVVEVTVRNPTGIVSADGHVFAYGAEGRIMGGSTSTLLGHVDGDEDTLIVRYEGEGGGRNEVPRGTIYFLSRRDFVDRNRTWPKYDAKRQARATRQQRELLSVQRAITA